MIILIDIMGWVGSILILTAYFLNSTHRIQSSNRIYQLMNIIGSAFLIVNTLHYRTYPLTMLNAVWLVIGITALLRILYKNKSD